eukprot:jgi/Mesen1/6724/ME000344S06010
MGEAARIEGCCRRLGQVDVLGKGVWRGGRMRRRTTSLRRRSPLPAHPAVTAQTRACLQQTGGRGGSVGCLRRGQSCRLRGAEVPRGPSTDRRWRSAARRRCLLTRRHLAPQQRRPKMSARGARLAGGVEGGDQFGGP